MTALQNTKTVRLDCISLLHCQILTKIVFPFSKLHETFFCLYNLDFRRPVKGKTRARDN
jgi:hypothetical protein